MATESECEAAATLIDSMLQKLRTIGEQRWKVSAQNPGAVFVNVLGAEPRASRSVYVEVAFQGKIVDCVRGDGPSLWKAFQECGRKLRDHSTLPKHK